MHKINLAACVSVLAIAAAGGAQAGTLFIANLSGAQEVPPTAVPFTGRGTVILNDAETMATVRATNDIPPPLAAGHIHRGPVGVNGPVIFPFPNPVGNTVGPLTWAIPAADVVNLKNQGLYFNFHTPAFPGGAIRGQILRFSFAPAALAASQAAVAGALDVSAGRDADLDQVLITLAFAPIETRSQALDDLSARTVYAQGRQANEALAGFQNSLFGLAVERRAAKGFGGFLVGGEAFGRRDADPGQAGSKVSRPSVLGGVDFAVAEGARAGLALGYASGRDRFKDNIGRTRAKTTAVQAYFAGGGETLRVAAVAGYGWTDFDTTRNLSSLSRTATSSHQGKVWSLGARVEAPMPVGDMTLSPYGQLDMQRATIDAYVETGAGAAGLVVPKRKEKTAGAEAGAALTLPFGGEAGAASLRLEAGYRYLLDDGKDTFAAALVGSPTTFQTQVLSPGRSAAHLGAAFNARLGENLTASAGYHGLIGKRADIHTVQVRLNLAL